jgi:hypothetical protein
MPIICTVSPRRIRPLRRLWLSCLPLGFSLATTVGFAGEGPNLVYNGDFELDSPDSPPPGWTMWGAQQYKVPANFTRDTAAPHEGKACFRIHHPADTAGYVVSSPEYAIRPRTGMRYDVSFWARTSRPGASQFGITAYATINPFTDAPAPGFFPLDVGAEWKQFAFRADEGWDFDAERSRYLLLTFRATTVQAEATTLWLDDVVVTEQKSPREGRLLDEASLQYEPLQHRLQAGEELNLVVDAKKLLRPANRNVGGVSFHRVAGFTRLPYDRDGKYNLSPEQENAVRELRLPMTRFYGVGDEPFSLEDSLDKAAEVCRRVNIPLDTLVLEFETQGAERKLAPDAWARGVRHSVARGYGFHYWEISNEPYLGRPGTAFASPEEYVEHAKAVADAIRKVQPEAQIGVAINKGSLKWGNYVLKLAAGHYDFVVGHYYAVSNADKRKFEVATLTENYKTLDQLLKINALMRAYNPGREVYQLDTEWGMHSGGPNGERADDVNRNANIFGTIHRAARLIYYAREELLRGAGSWQMFSYRRSPGFGVLATDAPDKRCMGYWLYYYFNRHVGRTVLDAQGTAPYYTPAKGDDPYTNPGAFPGPLTPALVTLSEDGKTLYFVIANGSWDRTVPCRVALRNFAPGKAEGTVLSSSDPDANPLLERKEDFVADLPVQVTATGLSCSLPPHSAVFVSVRGG